MRSLYVSLLLASASASATSQCSQDLHPAALQCPDGLDPVAVWSTSSPEEDGLVEGTDPKFRLQLYKCVMEPCPTKEVPTAEDPVFIKLEAFFASCSSDPNSESQRSAIRTKLGEFQTRRVGVGREVPSELKRVGRRLLGSARRRAPTAHPTAHPTAAPTAAPTTT